MAVGRTMDAAGNSFFAATMPAKESKSALRWVTIISIKSNNFYRYIKIMLLKIILKIFIYQKSAA
jgi:hypothetical protein